MLDLLFWIDVLIPRSILCKVWHHVRDQMGTSKCEHAFNAKPGMHLRLINGIFAQVLVVNQRVHGPKLNGRKCDRRRQVASQFNKHFFHVWFEGDREHLVFECYARSTTLV